MRTSPLKMGGRKWGLLLLAAPDKDGCAPELAAAVVIGRQSQVRAPKFLFDDNGVGRCSGRRPPYWVGDVGQSQPFSPRARPILRRFWYWSKERS